MTLSAPSSADAPSSPLADSFDDHHDDDHHHLDGQGSPHKVADSDSGHCRPDSNGDDCDVDDDDDSNKRDKCNSSDGGGSSSRGSDRSRWHEPIVVGYAFGPKKMSTMGVVMAEASRIKVIHEELDEDGTDGEGEDQDQDEDHGDDDDNDEDEDEDNDEETFHEDEEEVLLESHCADDDASGSPSGRVESPPAPASSPGAAPAATKKETAVTTNTGGSSAGRQRPRRTPSKLTSAALRGLDFDGTTDPESTIISLGNTDETDIKQIVRYFRSSCSSAAASTTSMSETTVSTPTTAATASTSAAAAAVPPTRGDRHRRRSRSRHPVRISFVPLDPGQPLEHQHGGSFDLILHKLTEDILSCSLTTVSASGRDGCRTLSEDAAHSDRVSNDPSWRRVRSLQDYHRRNSRCCLVDDPARVQIVMSRSDIANVLQEWLPGAKTASGIPVRSPKFVVIPEAGGGSIPSEEEAQRQRLERQLKEEGLATPLIVKPLIAAGTKESHSMLIALDGSALGRLPSKSIVQEYVNHDATLYKVYVLGGYVSVYERHSLPNLPADVSDRTTVGLVEFDSQRPYPTLDDFGLLPDGGAAAASAAPGATPALSPPVIVTAEEVTPIVDVLKRAFGLELFGFDILVGSTGGEWLVVDVNYFPSYKEVPDFPSLLAQYLTQRVLEQRRRGQGEEGVDYGQAP